MHVRTLERAYQEFGRAQDVAQLIASLKQLPLADGAAPPGERPAQRPLRREDLHLVCYDFVWS